MAHTRSPRARGKLLDRALPILCRAPQRGHYRDQVYQYVQGPLMLRYMRRIDTDVARELHEVVEPVIHMKQAKMAHDALAAALDSAHAVAFHNGLGAALYPAATSSIGTY